MTIITIIIVALSSKTIKCTSWHTCAMRAVCHADYQLSCEKPYKSKCSALINICNIGQGFVWSMHIFVRIQIDATMYDRMRYNQKLFMELSSFFIDLRHFQYLFFKKRKKNSRKWKRKQNLRRKKRWKKEEDNTENDRQKEDLNGWKCNEKKTTITNETMQTVIMISWSILYVFEMLIRKTKSVHIA